MEGLTYLGLFGRNYIFAKKISKIRTFVSKVNNLTSPFTVELGAFSTSVAAPPLPE